MSPLFDLNFWLIWFLLVWMWFLVCEIPSASLRWKKCRLLYGVKFTPERESGSDSDQTMPLPLRVTSGWQPQSFPSQLDLCFLGITRKVTLNSLPTIISKELNVLLMLTEFTSFWGCWIITRWKTWHSAYIRRRLDNLSKKKKSSSWNT